MKPLSLMCVLLLVAALCAGCVNAPETAQDTSHPLAAATTGQVTPFSPTSEASPSPAENTQTSPAEGEVTPLPEHISTDLMDGLYRTWTAERAPEIRTDQVITVTEITPAEVWQRLGAQAFTVQDEMLVNASTFLVKEGQLAALGTGFAGQGIEPGDLAVVDLDEDGRLELVFIYASQSGEQTLSQVGLLWWEQGSVRTLEAETAYEHDLDLEKLDDETVQILRAGAGEQAVLGELAKLSNQLLSVVNPQSEADSSSLYTSQRFGISFQYPAGWEKLGEDHYSGKEGFFEIISYTSLASALPQAYQDLALDVVRACEWEVNLEPGKYGSQPQVHIAGIDGPLARCLILPGEGGNETGGALLFKAPVGGYALLRSSVQHLEKISETMEFNFPGDQPPEHLQRPSAGPEGVPAELELAARQIGPLALEEWSLYPETLHTPLDPIALQDALAEVFPRRARWREPGGPADPQAYLDQQNALLEPFGYRLEQVATPEGDRLRVFQGETLVREGLGLWYPVATFQGADGSPDFALVLQEMQAEFTGGSLIRKGSIEPWDMDRHFWQGPVVIGGKLGLLELDQAGGTNRVLVRLNEETVYAYVSCLRQPGELGGIDLDAWGEGWTLDVNGTLVVDGRLLNPDLGYGEIFGWELLDGKPFFFFEKEGKFGSSYAGQELPAQWDEILHNQCCLAGMLNPNVNGHMAWFYARRDGKWFYVEVGIFE